MLILEEIIEEFAVYELSKHLNLSKEQKEEVMKYVKEVINPMVQKEYPHFKSLIGEDLTAFKEYIKNKVEALIHDKIKT